MKSRVSEEFTQPVSNMTLTECGAEIERLDRALAKLAGDDAAEASEGLKGRRRALHEALELRPAQSRDDAMAKFRWVLYESRGEPHLGVADTDQLVLVMKQVASFPAKTLH